MTPHNDMAAEGPLSWVERWTPTDAVLWCRWKASLSPEQRNEVLLRLQSVLSGLVAFREQGHAPRGIRDFGPHLRAVHAGYDWGVKLVRALTPAPSSHYVVDAPEASRQALELALVGAREGTERLLARSRADAVTFRAACDSFLLELDRNRFFRPPEPLELVNTRELLGSEPRAFELDACRGDAAKTTAALAFLALLRSHRFLGFADREIGSAEGLLRAHLVMEGVRRELATLDRFLRLQGAETFADERGRIEMLAVELGDAIGPASLEPIPALEEGEGLALPSERMRNAIREARSCIKHAARRLRDLAGPGAQSASQRRSERVQKSLHQDIWAFRLILRAFVTKAAATSIDASSTRAPGHLAFAQEFVRHFRVFGPRLAKGTRYLQRGPLIRSVSALGLEEEVDARTLGVAAYECERFIAHLDDALASSKELETFDKHRAAAELRDYLQSVRDRPLRSKPAAGAFGFDAANESHAG